MTNIFFKDELITKDVVRNMIADNLDKKEKFFGVDIERYISEGKL